MPFIFIHYFFPIIVLLSTSNFSTTETTSPHDFRNYVCYTTNKQILIDGKLDENVWGNVPFSDLFVDIEGSKKPAPLHDTKFKMLWDHDHLYIGVWIEEPHIWATNTKRESVIFHENDFEIFIDPNGDTHNYYEIEVNALNTIWDLLLTKPYRDRGKAITSWDITEMKSAVYLKGSNNDPSDVDEYWSAEFALPWNSLIEYARGNRKPEDGEQWRMNFSRVQWKLDIDNGAYKKRIDPEKNKAYSEYNWVWSPQGVVAMHQPETWGYIQFSEIVAGIDRTEFIFNKDELHKWELRKVYYAQKDFKHKNGRYADKFESLNIEIENCRNPSVMISTFLSGFEAKLICENNNKEWLIRQDGLIWRK